MRLSSATTRRTAGSAAPEEAPSSGLASDTRFERLQDLLLALRAHPREVAEPPPSAAPFSPSSDVIPSCVQMRAAVFGPTPGSRRKSTTPGGTRPRRFVSACISPSSTTSTTLSRSSSRSRELLRLPASASSAIGTADSLMRPAARRYAMTLNDSSSRISERSARRSSWSASSPLRGNVWASRDDTAMPRAVLASHVQRAREPGGHDRGARRGARHLDGSRAGHRRWLSRRDRRDRRPARRRALVGLRSPPRTKEGIGPAYVAGFRRALDEGAELVLEMDCDFSHDPADVPRLIAARRGRRSRARVALRPGWRDGELGLLRRIVSRGGCLYAQVILGLASATSPAASSASVALRSRPSTSMRSRPTGTRSRSRRPTGADAAGLRVNEVPITFVERGPARPR